MAGFNQATIVGNLTADPTVRYTASGTAVANITLAVNSKREVNGQWKDHVEYIDCVVWNKTAENLAQYCSKGRQILVSGSLQKRSWEKDGQKHYRTEVIANVVQYLGNKGDAGSSGIDTPDDNIGHQPDEVSDIEPF